MRTKLQLLVLLSAFCIQLSAFSQGALTPPGPPAPTMKTLDQLGTNILQVSNMVALASNRLSQISNEVHQLNSAEPRYPIYEFGTNLTVPGSYYLTANLFAGTSTADAINIRTNPSNITIDLNGFSIVTTNPPSGASPVGVRISGATNVTVRNGNFIGFDRGVRAEGACYGIVLENLHVQNVTRAGLEATGVAGNPSALTITMRNCLVEDVDGTGEGANVSCDGIVLLNCSGVVDSCVVRHIASVGSGSGTCINAVSATNSFINNNFLSDAQVGLSVSGGGTNRVFYRNNLTGSCTTPFSVNGGVDRGGNF